METIFIPTRLKSKVNKSKILAIAKRLPKTIAIAYSIQYEEIAKQIKIILKDKKITKFTQILGCSKFLLPKETQAVLLISDGRFHAVSLALESKLPIYILQNNKLEKISGEEVNKLKTKKKASYLKFLHANKIGILVSTKPGQENLKRAREFKNKIKDKRSYLFICNNINKNEFENFPDIQFWINSACPRLDFDSSIINLSDINGD